MNRFFKPLLLVFLYYLVSYVAILLVVAAVYVFGSVEHESSAGFVGMVNVIVESLMPYIGWITLASGMIVILCACGMKMPNLSSAFDGRNIELKSVWKPVVGSVLVIYILNTLISMFDVMPENLNEYYRFAQSPWNILPVCVFCPIVEEILFRESIIRYMQSNGSTFRQAIVFSSMCFAIAHGHPFQMVFAFVVGLLFACIYVKTGNVIITSIVHIINNSVFVITYNLVPNANAVPKTYGIIIILLISYPCYRLLRSFFAR